MKKITRVAFDSATNVQVVEITENNVTYFVEVEFTRINGIAPIQPLEQLDTERLNSLVFSDDANEIASVVETLKETTKTLIDLF
jgi:hypothetical protein